MKHVFYDKKKPIEILNEIYERTNLCQGNVRATCEAKARRGDQTYIDCLKSCRRVTVKITEKK